MHTLAIVSDESERECAFLERHSLGLDVRHPGDRLVRGRGPRIRQVAATHAQAKRSRGFLDFVASSVKEIFDGDMVRTIKTLIEEHSPNEQHRGQLEEVILRSTSFLHLFLRLQYEPGKVLCVVASQDARLGMILSLVRATVDQTISAP